MAEYREKWGQAKRSESHTVELTGAEVQKTVQLLGDRTSVRRYLVDRVEISTRWDIGHEPEGRTVAKLDCREIIGGHVTFRAHVLYPDQLDEVPAWLESIITRGSPRDVG